MAIEKKLHNKFDAAIPGQGLTKKPGGQAWETPPQYNTPDEFLMAMYANLTTKEGIQGIGALTEDGKRVSIEDLVKVILMGAIVEGKITPDVAMVSAEALGAILTVIVAKIHEREPLMSHKKDGPSKDMVRMALLNEYEKREAPANMPEPELAPPSGGLLSPRTS